ncbi:MAG TPA: type II toxin-antitoxin system Phd/YefM family antitoxin [bacterium]|nr:type II toxin-antitoxin system Phd/YefM family antitoxin [bacterium]
MKTLSLSEAKMKLSSLVSRVQDVNEQIMITRNGQPAAYLVNPDEFESWQETQQIIAQPELMDEIRKGLRRLRGKVPLYTLDELFAED